jgi:hypothetical protein
VTLPILVSANTAAELLGISRSQFDAKVAEGILPAPTRVLGRPLWCLQRLRMAVGAMPPVEASCLQGVEDVMMPPKLKEKWEPEL